MEHRKKKRDRYGYGLPVLGLLAVCFMLAACGPDHGGEEDTTAQSTQAESESAHTQSGTQPTQAPGEELMTEDETFLALIEWINPNEYTVETVGEYSFDGVEYYHYEISDSSANPIADVLVDREEGGLYYLNADGVIGAFTQFPPDGTQTVLPDGTISREEALALLSACTPDSLGLTDELSAYTVQFDSWTTIVEGKECYGINVYEETETGSWLAGVYYAALDGSILYRLGGEDGTFIEIS